MIKNHSQPQFPSFKSRPLTAPRPKKKQLSLGLNQMMFNLPVKPNTQTYSTQFFLPTNYQNPSQKTSHHNQIIQFDDLLLQDTDDTEVISNRDVFNHIQLISQQTKRIKTTQTTDRIPKTTTDAHTTDRVQKTCERSIKYPIKIKNEEEETIKPSIKIPNQALSPKSILKSPDPQDNSALEIQQTGLDSILEKQVLQIDEMEVKRFYEELNEVQGNLFQMFDQNQRFFDDLYDDGQFQSWLRVNKFVLTEQELIYVVEVFKYKQQMIEEGKNFSDIDFDVLDDILQKLGFFERFTKSTRINLYKLATYSEIPPGEYVFMQGDYGDNLFIILKGSVTVKADKKFEHELNVKQIITSLYDGQHFGEIAMLETKQKDEEEVLEEKLEDINISTWQEVKKELDLVDMKNSYLKRMKLKEKGKKECY